MYSQEELEKYSNNIEDAVQFGKRLIEWDTLKYNSGDKDLAPTLFLRNIIELADAISILIKQSSIDPCKVLVRTLIENSFGLEYLLEDNQEDRSLCYFVWQTKNDLKYYEKLDFKTQRGKQFRSSLEKDRLLENTGSLSRMPSIKAAKENAEELLKLDIYQPIVREYERTVNKGKKKNNNPNWYSLFDGPENIEELAKRLKLNASYEVLFRGYSDSVHANDNFKSKLIPNPDGTASIKAIRSNSELDSIYQNTKNFLILSYINYYKFRLPEKREEYLKWYFKFRETK